MGERRRNSRRGKPNLLQCTVSEFPANPNIVFSSSEARTAMIWSRVLGRHVPTGFLSVLSTQLHSGVNDHHNTISSITRRASSVYRFCLIEITKTLAEMSPEVAFCRFYDLPLDKLIVFGSLLTTCKFLLWHSISRTLIPYGWFCFTEDHTLRQRKASFQVSFTGKEPQKMGFLLY